MKLVSIGFKLKYIVKVQQRDMQLHAARNKVW